MAGLEDLDANYTTMPVPNRARTTGRGTAIDPLTSPYFGLQDSGMGSFSMGNGNGTGMLTGLEEMPGSERWYMQPSGSSTDPQPGRVDPQAFKAWMDENGYSLREESAGGGRVTRWMEDRDGNYVIQPQTMGSDKNWGRDFLVGSLALYGMGTALSGAIGGAGGATAGTTGTATTGGAGTITGGSGISAGSTAGFGGTGAGLSTAGTTAGGTATSLSTTGLGASGLGGAAAAGGGVAAAAGSPASAGGALGTEFGGLGNSLAQGAAGMNVSDWINLGGLVNSVVNRPDPIDTGPLERQADRSAAIADRQQTLAEQQYRDQMAIFEQFRPMLMQQIQGSLQDQQLSRERSNQQWADYMSTWRPAEQALAERSLNWATPGRMQAAADEASSAVAGAYDAQRQSATEDMIRAGLDPSSIASLQAAGRLVEAKDRAGAATGARRTVESQGMAYLDNAARFGRNMPSTGLAAAGLAGQQGQQVQSNYSGLVNATAAPAATASPLFGSAVSAGSSAGGLYGNIAGLQNASQNQRRDWDMGTLAGLNQWANGSGWFTGKP